MQVLLLVIAATAHASQPGDSPCSLISSTEIGAVTGVAVREGAMLFHGAPTSSCWFAGLEGGRIALFVRRLESGTWTAGQVDRMRRGVNFGSYREIEGVGERAFLLDRKGAATVLCVFDDRYYIQVAFIGIGYGTQRPEALEAVARTALRRLPSATARTPVVR
jgi:hypothetical protein